uniref:Vitellogenin n=1 Tax=Diaphanosoma celebensis TaxID=2184134 RepID=A0A6M3U208_9CRUS|nr:vitellogenin [Diaphanosoma celebensis]
MRLLPLVFVFAIGCCVGKVVEGPRRAAVHVEGRNVNGKLLIEQASRSSPVKIRGVIYGLESGPHGVHIHTGTQLGDRCDLVGNPFSLSEKEGERPVGFLGNVKAFAGNPSRADINILSSSLSLYEDSMYSIVGRPLVIYDEPFEYRGGKKYDTSDISACGIIEPTEERELPTKSVERDVFGLDRLERLEFGSLEGEKSWENVRHPFFGGASGKIPSNLNLEGVEKPDLTPDSLSLKSAVPTNRIWKSGYNYEYNYKGFIATGMFGLSPKVAGGSIEGRLVVEPVDESTINVALKINKAKMFNEDVLPELIEADPGTESRLVDSEHVERPFQVKIVNGKVESVAISKDEPLWTVNFKRGLTSKLQLQLDGSSGVFGDSALAGYYADNTVYHIMEGCSTGECETWYHISEISEEQLNAEPDLLPVPELCEKSQVYEIVKNRDLDKCRVLPHFHYNNKEGLRCTGVHGAGCENKVSHVDMVRYTGCRNSEGHFIIQRIKGVDKLVYKPFSYETEAAEGKTISFLTLRAIHTSGSSNLAKRIHSDVHLYQTLTYSFDDDYKTHGPLMGKPSLRSVNSPMIMDVDKETLKREAERLLSEITSELESESFYFDPSSKVIPARINMLRRAISSMNYTDLMALVNKAMTDNQWSTPNQIVLDALVLSGTNPALMVVRDLILKGRVSGEQAVQAVALLTGTVETPTKELLTSFLEMLKSDVVTGHRQLKITSALFVSKLVYQACINSTMSLNMFPKLVMGEFCNAGDNVVHQLVAWLAEELDKAADVGERIALLTALGNIGHEMVLPSVLPYITSCEPSTSVEYEWIERNRHTFESGISAKELRQKWLKYKKSMHHKKEYAEEEEEFEWQLETAEEDEATCNLVRSKAIFSLTELAMDKNEVVGSILMPIFFNKNEDTGVRLAALTVLFMSNPPEAFWTRVALSTWFEPNEQVAHYIYTTIASLVNNKDPMRRRVVLRAESVVPLMKPMLWTSHSAINYLKAGYQERTRVGYVTETISFPGFESFIPSHFSHSVYLHLGPWFTKLVEYSICTKQAEKFIDRLLGKPDERSSSKFFGKRGQSEHKSLREIHEELKIEARATGQPELYLYVNFLDNYERFFTLNPTTAMNVFENLIAKKGFMSKSGQNAINYHKYVPVYDAFLRIPSSMGLAYTVIGHHSIFVSLKGDVRGGWDSSSLSVNLEGQLKPVFIYKKTMRLMSETPFTRTYPFTGVNCQSALALPGRFSVTGDLKSTKLTTSWELVGDKVRLIKYSVRPFTSIRRVDDYTPALLLKGTEFINLLEEPKEFKYNYGRPLGLNLNYVERGDIGTEWTPFVFTNDWFGNVLFSFVPSTLRYRDVDVYLDVSGSSSKVLNTYWSFSSKSGENLKEFGDYERSETIAPSLFDVFFGNKFDRPEEWTSRKFQRVFKSMTSPHGYSLDFNFELTDKSGGIKPRRYGASFTYGIGDYGKSHRGSFLMERRDPEWESEPEGKFVFCADYEAKYPENVAFKRDQLRRESERNAILNIAFGKSCTDDRKITVTTKMTSGEEEKPFTVRSKWAEDRCTSQELSGRYTSDECLTSRYLASILNKAEITIEYNEMPPVVRNMTTKFGNAWRHYMAPYMSDNQVDVRNKENEIRIEYVYHPIIGTMDMRFYKPWSNTFYHGINVHPVAEVLLPTRHALPRNYIATPNMCFIDRDAVNTFDGLNYNATIGGCEQVVTKDCSGRYKFAVLVRHESGKKIVTVLLNDEKIEINADQMKIKVNDMDLTLKDSYVVKDAENNIKAQIRRTPDNYVELYAPDHLIRVVTSGRQLYVNGSPVHRGRLCGLCGTADGDKIDDLTGPRRSPLPDELMSVAYEMPRPSGCKSIKRSEWRDELKRIQDKYVEETKSSVFGLSDAQPLLPRFQQTVFSTYVPRSTSHCLQYRNKMIMRDGKRCFSTISIPKCAEGCRPVSTVEKKLPFHCMPKNYLAEKLSEEALYRPLSELSGKEVTFVQSYKIPTNCVPVS